MEKLLSPELNSWQLQMFGRSLKKQAKLRALLSELDGVTNQKCLLVTCGDNNGALNWHFRAFGGHWIWGEVKGENLEEIGRLLGEEVHHVTDDHLPFPDGCFDCVVCIDVLEHLDDDQPFLCELHRVLHPGGRAVVTVPNGDPNLLVNRIKWGVGMTPEVYGHSRAGYTLEELRIAMEQVRFMPVSQNSYSGPLTEMIELALNFGYVFILKRKNKGSSAGEIAPTSADELKMHGTAYQLYSLFFPIMKLISKLDGLFPARTHGAVIVTAFKSSNN